MSDKEYMEFLISNLYLILGNFTYEPLEKQFEKLKQESGGIAL